MNPNPHRKDARYSSRQSEHCKMHQQGPSTIPPGTDLNALNLSQNRDRTEEIQLVSFPHPLYDKLPGLLGKGCAILQDSVERQVFLMGALGVVSGILPNIFGRYGGKSYCPHLFCYILAPYGEGKGSLEYARQLAMPIHETMRAEAKVLEQSYQRAKLKFEKELSEYKKGTLEKPPTCPSFPPNRLLFIPANNSKTGVFELLSENQGNGIIFETEGDTLADALKQDYGNFSDGMRKAYHHERIDFYRRTNKEFVDIPYPRLAVVLSSTPDQLLRLIPSVENGLFSRFCFCILATNPDFANVFDKQKHNYDAAFDALGQEFLLLYQHLARLEKGVEFSLQPHQEQLFHKQFSTWKTHAIEQVSPILGGSIHRLGLMCFRIAMQLTVLRRYEEGKLASVLVCDDTDFDAALTIVQVLKEHMVRVFQNFPQRRGTHNASTAAMAGMKQAQIQECERLHRQGLSLREIALLVLGSETKQETVRRWLGQ